MKWNVLKNNKFSISKTWKVYRTDYNSLPWFKIVWGKNSIPKHSFILWLAIKNRLKTKDKLKRWGVTPDDHCVLCILLLKFGKPWEPFAESIRTLGPGEELSVGLAERALGKVFQPTFAELYIIWITRNKKIFLNENGVPAEAVKRIRSILLDKFNGYSTSTSFNSIMYDIQQL
ncbi:uncharacterized protein LOC126656852 [Mercurialis annua]|uniref:uncharacterized protein LOC126656852 n=1 Tax=Mercurialis annua TaxID=3986 RepID=UPI00215E2180|nr:uncharacterized protein LOC126656852 [Mercurialis annua]